MNAWIDAHWAYVEEPWEEETEDRRIPPVDRKYRNAYLQHRERCEFPKYH